MGNIRQEVQKAFFENHREVEKFIKVFLNGFDISFAAEKHCVNTVVSAFILKPEEFMAGAFGFDKEILLVYSPFTKVEPRLFQAIEEIYKTSPFEGRVDTLNCFLLSKDENVEERIKSSLNSENLRIIVPFSVKEAQENMRDSWYVRNKLRSYFFGLDLFGYYLPLQDDTYFFGRKPIVARYIDAIKRGENRGIFGLRKTGKTSLLYKIERIVSEQRLGKVLHYDCKSTLYRNLDWLSFLYEIYSDICHKIDVEPEEKGDEFAIIKKFRDIVEQTSKINMKIVLVFDEIEYISFKAPLNKHWETEFIDFWQTIWSIQSMYRNFVFIVAGVNASVSEIDTIKVGDKNIQNPLFGIVQSEYLQGLTYDECNGMIKTLGKRMGLKFQYKAVNAIYQQYGGHPMLTRLACSKVNMYTNDMPRPIEVSAEQIEQLFAKIDIDLTYYFKHIVSELQEFYPDEYVMFELLASGQKKDFIELAASVEWTKHLYDYGLIENDDKGIPKIKLPVAGQYVAIELAKKEGRSSSYKVVDKKERAKWISLRVMSIIQDMRQLEMVINRDGLPKLFGKHSFPESDRLMTIAPVVTQSDFVSFINVMNRCFVESIECYGKENGKADYFWKEMPANYSALYEVMYRIKVYRNSQDHLTLNKKMAEDYNDFFNEDTNGISDIEDKYFVIQQKLLDNLLLAIQIETNKLV